MKMYSIYALYNPETDLPFYVGATVNSLEKRLHEHLSFNVQTKKNYSIIKKRHKFMKDMLVRGVQPTIKLLEMCSLRRVNSREEYYYNVFTSSGIELLQSNRFFNYSESKKDTYSIRKSGFKIISLRVNLDLYKKIQTLCEKNRRKAPQQLTMIIEDHFTNLNLAK